MTYTLDPPQTAPHMRCSDAARAVILGAMEPTALLDEGGRVLCHNAAMQQLLAPRGGTTLGVPVWNAVHPRHHVSLRSCYASALRVPGVGQEKRLRLTHADGSEHTLLVRLSNLVAQPELGGVLLTVRDLGRLERAEEQLLRGSVRDRSSGLPGRPFFLDQIARASVEGRRVSVLVMEVNGFGSVRGGWGLTSGDGFLSALVDRLRSALPDGATLARLDGDQLGILVEVTGPSAAEELSETIQLALRRPLDVGGRAARCSARIGIADDTGARTDPSDRVRRALLASRWASGASSVDVARYQPQMDEQVEERLDAESGLRRALDHGGELEAFYQPIVDLRSERVTSFEALIRWRHPARGLLPAGAFVPHAEESDLILELGWWILDDVCADLGTRVAQGAHAVPVHVNLAPGQVGGGELVDRVRATLERHRCPATLLHLELTESSTALSPDELAHVLTELRSLGVEISIDDFGTGQSSLSYLHRIPADVLKIDRSFVTDIAPGAKQEPLVRTIVSVARELRLKVIAEGIETASEAELLRSLGCEMGQGYLFSRPVPRLEAYHVLEAES